MTRVNLVDPAIMDKHSLSGERKEIYRVFTLSRECYWMEEKKRNKVMKKRPRDYTLGTGHCLFLYDKIGFVMKRLRLLDAECLKRGWNITIIPDEQLLALIPKSWCKDYEPTAQAMAQSVARLKERGQLLCNFD